ncbi:hypothetical protein [Nocardia sp. Marseille-Q1738]
MTAPADQEELDARASLPEVVHGYRFDGIRPNGTIGFYGAPEAKGPRFGNRPSDDRARWTPAAFCVQHDHIAPVWDCWCGWHVVADLTELAEYRPSGLGLDVSLRGRDDIAARPVIAEVTARGPKLPGLNLKDPPSTVRATWLRLEGRIWIREGVARPIVRAARRRYPYARIERYSSIGELAGIVGEN